MFDNLREDIDRYVYTGHTSPLSALLLSQGLWAIVQYRYSHWVHVRVHISVIRQLLKLFGLIWHKTVEIATGIDLPEAAEIGKGLYIGHFGGIIVSSGAKIGDYCNLSQGVTIGMAGRGESRGCPVIGDRVYIAPGAKVIGKITIGNDVAIGANAVVTKDLPDRAVAVGIPAKVINFDGSTDFVRFRKRADYQPTGESVETDHGQ